MTGPAGNASRTGLPRRQGAEGLGQLRAHVPRQACWTCECLLALVTQWELDAGENVSDLTGPLRQPPNRRHGCLGCDLCPPARAHAHALPAANHDAGAAQEDDAQTAAQRIDQALALLEKQHMGMHDLMKQHMRKMHKGTMPGGMMDGWQRRGMSDDTDAPAGMKCPVCGTQISPSDADQVSNARCPIMGTKLDRDHVPDNLTRMSRGKKVGFCCAGCPKAWDKLSDPQKQEKLEAAMGAQKKTRRNSAGRGGPGGMGRSGS